MKATIYILSILTLILGGVAVALGLQPTLGQTDSKKNINRYGLHEGLELVDRVDGKGYETFAVVDENDRLLFAIPLRNCMFDVRYRNGQLRFRENGTGREGFVDRNGNVTFFSTGTGIPSTVEQEESSTMAQAPGQSTYEGGQNSGKADRLGSMTDGDLKQMARSNPFYKEAAKILAGKLSVDDAQRRRVILNYCEHFRMAYTTKDIDFLRQVFSEQALIIVGNVVKTKAGSEGKFMPASRVEYNIRTKKEYISRLSKAFAASKNISVKFSDFRIMRHPTMDGIYGVSLRQQYKSDRYADDGYLFLLWDFRNESMPLIHVRTWQPTETISDDNEVMNIRDFNLE